MSADNIRVTGRELERALEFLRSSRNVQVALENLSGGCMPRRKPRSEANCLLRELHRFGSLTGELGRSGGEVVRIGAQHQRFLGIGIGIARIEPDRAVDQVHRVFPDLLRALSSDDPCLDEQSLRGCIGGTANGERRSRSPSQCRRERVRDILSNVRLDHDPIAWRAIIIFRPAV